MVSSPEYFNDNGSTNQGYVLGLYNDALDRTPTTAELEWLGQRALNSGTSRLAVAVSFLTSTEYRTDLVDTDYHLYLGKSPDPTGLAFWLSAIDGGATDQEVLAGILGSPEGFTKWS